MTIKTAIEKAIKGGYDESKRLTALGVMKSVHEMLLDIEFWKCLGNEERWIGYDHLCDDCYLGKVGNCSMKYPIYRLKQHQFIDHIQDSEDIETAFDLATK